MSTTQQPTDTPATKLKAEEDKTVRDIQHGNAQQAVQDLHQTYLDFKKNGGKDSDFWATMKNAGLTDKDMKYLSLEYGKENWSKITEGYGSLDGNAIIHFDAMLKGDPAKDPEVAYEHLMDAALRNAIDSDPAFHSAWPGVSNYAGQADLDKRLAEMKNEEVQQHGAPDQPSDQPLNGDQKHDSQALLDFYKSLSKEQRDKLFGPDGMNQQKVDELLKDPNAHLTPAQKAMLTQLDSYWPAWALDGSGGNKMPIKIDDIAKTLGTTPDAIQADITKNNADVANALNALRADLDKTNPEGLFKDGNVTQAQLEKLMNDLPDGDPRKAAYQKLISDFKEISSNGTDISPGDLAAYGARHGLVLGQDGTWKPASDNPPPAATGPDDHQKALDAAYQDALKQLMQPQTFKFDGHKTLYEQARAQAAAAGITDPHGIREYMYQMAKANGWIKNASDDKHWQDYVNDGNWHHLPRDLNGQLKANKEYKLPPPDPQKAAETAAQMAAAKVDAPKLSEKESQALAPLYKQVFHADPTPDQLAQWAGTLDPDQVAKADIPGLNDQEKAALVDKLRKAQQQMADDQKWLAGYEADHSKDGGPDAQQPGAAVKLPEQDKPAVAAYMQTLQQELPKYVAPNFQLDKDSLGQLLQNPDVQKNPNLVKALKYLQDNLAAIGETDDKHKDPYIKMSDLDKLSNWASGKPFMDDAHKGQWAASDFAGDWTALKADPDLLKQLFPDGSQGMKIKSAQAALAWLQKREAAEQGDDKDKTEREMAALVAMMSDLFSMTQWDGQAPISKDQLDKWLQQLQSGS